MRRCSPVQTWCCGWPAWACASGWQTSWAARGWAFTSWCWRCIHCSSRWQRRAFRWRLPGSWPRNSAARLPPVVQPAECCAVCWRQDLCWGCLPLHCSWRQRILRPGCGLAMSAPSVLCAFQRWECHGWQCLRSCGAFSSPGGMWPPMCSASLPSRRCASRWWHWRLPAPRALRWACAVCWCWELPPSAKRCRRCACWPFTGGMPAVPLRGKKPSARQTLPAVCGRSCGRWRAGGCWQAPCTRRRICWCPPALRSI